MKKKEAVTKKLQTPSGENSVTNKTNNTTNNTPPPAYTVIRDTREKQGQGWLFEQDDRCAGTITKSMKTGDYTLLGCEDILTIERKRNVAEIAGNILEDRFERELERMKAFRFGFVVCEFTYADIWKWPLNSGLPPYKQIRIKTTKNFIMKRLTELQLKYDCQFIMGGIHAKDVVVNIFNKVNEFYRPAISKEKGK